MKQQLPRSRPTNNQLLYKAHFRWEHYTQRQVQTDGLPQETEPCASVTAAFLKVLGILQSVEGGHPPKRNILQILATNTRRTKVLELSSGTHRIPDELKKHYLTDELGAQYSTNLDRNRYGSDNNYLFTVIKHDLETLGLCPCLVDVEIIDAKAQGDSQLVTAGLEACICSSRGAGQPVQQPAAQGECSQLFEALVLAAADATEQADTDTAAQQVVTQEVADQSKGAAPVATTEHPVNGMLAATHAPGADGLTPSPRKRRTPRRVPTGLFSVNSSDLMGCGFSNLGNSGLVVGELDLDRKGEVEQRPTTKRARRVAVDADTISEQGDTDRYLKSINAEAPDASEPWRHARVPRQNSMVGVGVAVGDTTVSKDARTLVGEVQQLQQNQVVMRQALEAQKRSAVESELLIGQLQRGVQALHEDRTKLQRTLEATEKRVGQLESALSMSNAQVNDIRSLVMRLVASDRDGVVDMLRGPALNSGLPVPASHQQANMHAAAVAAAAYQDGGVALEAEAHQRKENARAGGVGVSPAGAVAVPDGAQQHQKQRDGSGAMVTPVGPPAVALEKKLPSLMDVGAVGDVGKLTPTQTSLLAVGSSGATENRAAPAAGSDLPGQGGLGLNDGDAQVMPELGVKAEDCEAIKKLPKFDNFGSLSDLGSLFSGGAGKSVDVRSGSRQPPRANVSITSPHPIAMAKTKNAAAEAKEDPVQVT